MKTLMYAVLGLLYMLVGWVVGSFIWVIYDTLARLTVMWCIDIFLRLVG